VISVHALRFGAMIHPQPNSFWTKIESLIISIVHWIPIEDAIALEAANIRAHLKRKGETAASHDSLTGETALGNGWVLVTGDIKHFRSVAGLQLENWFK
jgi:tRNA(fMet)-specific endonuclease VapC